VNNLKRVTWIDLCKGGAIILVLLGHTYSTNNGLLIWLNSFHMPLFFMITGLLMGMRKIYDRPLKKILSDNVRSLLIPYFVYSILLAFFIQFLRTRGGDGFVSGVADSLKYVFMLYGNSPMWFLSCLFLAELLLVSVHRLPDKVRYLLVLLGLAAGVCMPHEALMPALLCRVLRAVFFLTVGEVLSSTDLEKYRSLFLPMLAAQIFLSRWNGSDAEFGNSRIAFIVCALTGSIAAILFSAGFLKNAKLRLLEHYGKNTLTILCTHPFIIEMIRLADYKVLGSRISGFGILEGIVITIIVLIVEIPVIWIVANYLPVLAGKKRAAS
jgi:fucose 4-O-acetylase-like acetyltransferase